MLLTNLLESDETEYRFAASAFQRLISSSIEDNSGSYQCINPHWFDSELSTPREVDSTTCMLCGYRKYCSLGRFDDREYVEIVRLDSSRMPSKKLLQQRCFCAFDSNGNPKVIDPFLGFTRNAYQTRKLYLISQDEFSRRFPDHLNHCQFDAAVGYDSQLQQAIWPIDHLFLEKYERKRVALQWELDCIEPNALSSGNLQQLDQICLGKIAFERGWLTPTDPRDYHDALHLLMSRFVGVLKQQRIFSDLAAIPMVPKIDHPFNYSGSGLLHLAIRWIELIPTDLDRYIKELGAPDLEQENQEHLAQRLRVTSHPEITQRDTRYLPRFPMISIISEARLSEVQFEQAAGRIIDVILAEDDSNLLLIDSLGIDLSDGWM